MEEQSNIIKKLVFRLVRKHIAGSTSGAVLKVVRDLNSKGFHTTVTLLNDHVEDQTKARYNTNAYIQSIRQLSRLHLNSDMSIRLSQIGAGIEASLLSRNMHDIVGVANSCRQRLWIESEPKGNGSAISMYRKLRPRAPLLGIEMRPDYAEDVDDNPVLRMASNNDIIKLMAPIAERERNGTGGRSMFKAYKEYIDRLMDKKASLTIIEDDPKLINRIISTGKDYKRNLIFEIPLGYSGRKLAELQKSKLNLSVYVPYGKDWIPYFINRLAEGRVRNIAVALLNGEKSSVGLNVRNEDAKAG
ncbi:MAG: hypothetical protein ACREBH_02585 [Candidatus Micrarchaeaceae archaeon]